MNPLLEKPPTNGALCTAWILQGPFDVSTWLNWYMFYQGQQGVRGRFLDMWEYLAGTVSSGSLLIHSTVYASGSSSMIFSASSTQRLRMYQSRICILNAIVASEA